ncbi:MAG: hypothetical protein HOP28_11450 [Gemmatimonadales bacterium]|nr:hypothetical protein [Gemmatimonadales bacterium]
MTLLGVSGQALVKLMGETPRGPKREGIFALWLTLRVAEDMLLVPQQTERAMKRRVAALQQRLSSLSFPAPLRRALALAIHELRDPTRERASVAIQQLVAPAREALGGEAGDVVARAARMATQRVRGEPD